MKKVLVAFSCVVFILVAMASCKELVDKIFTGIDVNAPDRTTEIPVIPIPAGFPPIDFPAYTQTTAFNLDSMIKASSGGVFNIGYVKSIKIKSMTLTIPEADAANNLSTFESIRVTISSNTNTTEQEIAKFAFADTLTRTSTYTVANSPELFQTLKGSQVVYTTYTRLRRGTTKKK